jgi:acyl-homoserine-lactone acylase
MTVAEGRLAHANDGQLADNRGPIADAVLTYGQSSQADSPYSYDQLEAFSRKEMMRLPFHADDVARQRAGEVLRLRMP